MKFSAVTAALVISRAVGHERQHGHGHGHAEETPLHEREWVKDSKEELERKWSFEVSHLELRREVESISGKRNGEEEHHVSLYSLSSFPYF
jgi:hypothetical protein